MPGSQNNLPFLVRRSGCVIFDYVSVYVSWPRYLRCINSNRIRYVQCRHLTCISSRLFWGYSYQCFISVSTFGMLSKLNDKYCCSWILHFLFLVLGVPVWLCIVIVSVCSMIYTAVVSTFNHIEYVSFWFYSVDIVE